jgi:hypothetical protein
MHFVFCPQTEIALPLPVSSLSDGWKQPQIATEFKLHYCKHRSQPASVLSSWISPLSSLSAEASSDGSSFNALVAEAASGGLARFSR